MTFSTRFSAVSNQRYSVIQRSSSLRVLRVKVGGAYMDERVHGQPRNLTSRIWTWRVEVIMSGTGKRCRRGK